MTNKEALEIIEAYRDKLKSSASNELDEDIAAFDAAIDALKIEKTGHWISNFNGTMYCSRCHTWFKDDDRYYYMHHCPYCGAKMETLE